MFGKKTKPSNCKIGRPCGLGCVPKSHNCKGMLKGAAKTLVQWLSNVTTGLIKKGKNYLDNHSRNKRKERIDRQIKEREELERKRELIQKENEIYKQRMRRQWHERKTDPNKAKTLSGLDIEGEMEVFVMAGTDFNDRAIENQIKSYISQVSFFSFHDIDKEIIDREVDKYIAKNGGNKKELSQKIYDFESGRIDYGVNGSAERIPVGKSDYGNYTGKDVTRIGLKAFRTIKNHLETIPDGVILHCTFYDGDGDGEYRKNTYNKMGFGQPIEELTDEEGSPYQFAIKRNGRLYPLTKSHLFTEIIESE